MFAIRVRGLFAVMIALVVLGGFASGVSAATLDFESLGTPSVSKPINDGYGDLNWDNFSVVTGSRFPQFPGNGYTNGASSGQYVGFNNFAEPASFSSGSTFDFISASLTAAFNDGLELDVVGYLNGAQIYTRSITLTTEMYATILFNWTGIDMVTFNSHGGTPKFSVSGEQFAIDDLTVVKTPIPAALPLLATGLLGLGYAARRRRTASKAA